MSTPLDRGKLIDLLESASPAQHNQIRAALLAEHPDDRDEAERVFELALDEVIHNANVTLARASLAESLRQLEVHAGYALTHLEELMTASWDSEYEGPDGVDLKAHLDGLRRAAHLASVLNRHIRRFDDPEYAKGGNQ